MSLSLAIALNVLLDLGLIALLAYVMSSASRLTPRRPAAGRAALRSVAGSEQTARQAPVAALDLAA